MSSGVVDSIEQEAAQFVDPQNRDAMLGGDGQVFVNVCRPAPSSKSCDAETANGTLDANGPISPPAGRGRPGRPASAGAAVAAGTRPTCARRHGQPSIDWYVQLFDGVHVGGGASIVGICGIANPDSLTSSQDWLVELIEPGDPSVIPQGVHEMDHVGYVERIVHSNLQTCMPETRQAPQPRSSSPTRPLPIPSASSCWNCDTDIQPRLADAPGSQGVSDVKAGRLDGRV